MSKPPKHKPAGLPAPASNGPLPTIGQLRSNIFTLISVRGMGAARQELAWGLRSMGPPSQSAQPDRKPGARWYQLQIQLLARALTSVGLVRAEVF